MLLTSTKIVGANCRWILFGHIDKEKEDPSDYNMLLAFV